MLSFELTPDHRHFAITRYDLKSEINSLRFYFQKKKEAYYSPFAGKGKPKDHYHCFIDNENRLGSGLWKEVIKFSEKYGFDVDLGGLDELLNLNITKEGISKFSDVLLEGCPSVPQLRPYQLEAAYRGIKYKMCTQELATSGGKTVIFYIYLAFLKRKGILSKDKKAILVVPNIKLVTQTQKAFNEEYHTGLLDFNIMMMGGDHSFNQKKFDDCDILITTYQSLVDRPKDFFSKFNVICIDECHFSRGKTIRKMLDYTSMAEYKLGLSGTIKIKPEHIDFFAIQEKLGPLMLNVSAKHLQENKYSADVEIRQLHLEYTVDDFIKEYQAIKLAAEQDFSARAIMGKDLYLREKQYIISSEKRLDYINSMTKRLTGGNTLILFTDVKNGYGKRISDKIREWNPNCYYVDGNIKEKQRTDFTDIMEAGRGVVLVASYGTFSTGINLKNLDYIIFAESYKSEIIVRQSIGRGMRLFRDKTKVIIFDLIDIIMSGGTEWLTNTVQKHGKIRAAIYRRQSWPIKKFVIKL